MNAFKKILAGNHEVLFLFLVWQLDIFIKPTVTLPLRVMVYLGYKNYD